MNTYTNSPQNRILSAPLAIIMLMSVMPLSVFTADDHSAKGAVSDTATPPDSNAADGDVAEVTVGNTTTPYDDITKAFDAAKYASGSVTVKLLDDIDSFATGFSRAYGVQFQSGDVTLDLNGHYLERYNNSAGTIANNRAVFLCNGKRQDDRYGQCRRRRDHSAAERPCTDRGFENNYYGSLEFSVTDANDFTVWMDGEEITLVNGKYTMEPDNGMHLITATDVAGNTVSFRFGIFKTYHVTLPTGAGYMIFHSDGLAVRHGNSFSFIVQFNKGYSKTEDFRVLVNGNKLDELMSDADSASFVVRDVSEDLVITVEGVADITSPEVEVSIRGNSFKEFLNRITFGLFFKQTQTVEVKANDYGSGIDKVEYLLSETPFADRDAIIGNWTAVTLDSDWKAYFSIAPNPKTFVYVRVTDKSGNITVVNSEGVVVYTDAEAVTDVQTFTMDSGSNVLYGLKLNGNALLAVYNGTEEIRSVTDYSLIENGANVVLTLKNKYLRTLAAGEYTLCLIFKPMGESYVDNYGNDAPTEIVLKLTVEKKTPTLDHKLSDGKICDGKSIDNLTFNTDSDGALTFEYKRAGEDDTAYTTVAPKNVGKYIIRITTAETDTFKAATSTIEFEIQHREVTISDVKVSDKTYDGTTNATITDAGTLSFNYDGENLTIVSGNAFYTDKNVGNGKTVSFRDFTLSGSAAGNYKLIAQPADVTASITRKTVTVADLAVSDK